VLSAPAKLMEIKTQDQNLFDLGPAAMAGWFEQIGERGFRAQQVMKWIYHQGVTDFSAMSNLSLALREQLQSLANLALPEMLSQQVSKDGTVKWLFEVGGANAIETVFIPEAGRGTLCVSSQVGCALNCSFCATGAQGFNRNLSTSQIIGQVWQAAKALGHQRNGERKITNVVMMGMGEPLLNLDAVLPALELMRDDLGYGFASRRVTGSTAGWFPGIDKINQHIDVALAVSLHSPVDELRNELVPLNKKYPIAELMQACQRFVKDKHKRSVTFEYTLIDGVNDHPEHARQLIKLLRRVPSKLNLIPFNPFPGTRYRCSTAERIERFQQIIMRGDIIATVRKTRGDDINAACGQLAGDFSDRTRRRERIQMQLQACV